MCPSFSGTKKRKERRGRGKEGKNKKKKKITEINQKANFEGRASK